MPPAKIKIEFCTSCGSQEIQVTGNSYYCPDCDVTYKVTTQGTKVIDSNPLGKEKTRLDQVEKDVAALKGKQEPGSEPAEPATDSDDVSAHVDENKDEDGLDKDGNPKPFVTW